MPTAYNQKQLERFCKTGNLEEVTKILATEWFTSFPDTRALKPLKTASKNGHVEIVKAILQNQKKSPYVDFTSLATMSVRMASKKGQLNLINVLLKEGYINSSTDVVKAIRLATINQHAEVVKLLWDKASSNSWVPENELKELANEMIILANKKDDIEIVKFFLNDFRIDLWECGNTLICAACEMGNLEIVELLLLDPRISKSGVIRNASRGGHAEIVKLLLEKSNDDPSSHGNLAIRSAKASGHESVVAILSKDPRVDPTAMDKKVRSLGDNEIWYFFKYE